METAAEPTWVSLKDEELLALRGIYWKLYQLQYKDQELRASL